MPKTQGNRLWPIVIPKNGLELALGPGLASASPCHEPVIKAVEDKLLTSKDFLVSISGMQLLNIY